MVSAIPRSRRVRTAAMFATAALAAAGAVVAVTTEASAAVAPYGNLSEALHKSLYFYDAEKSGAARTMGRQPLEWRGDSEVEDAKIALAGASDGSTGTNLPSSLVTQYKAILDPDGDGTVDLSGGFHDAGDHVKFGLPQSYAAATLGWGVYEFADAFKATGAYDHAMDELRWFSDYFLRSTFRNAAGEVIAFNYMVGRGGVDHTYWGPPELQDPAKYPRPGTFAHAGSPGSDQAAGAAAALTVMSLITKADDASYSTTCLDVAKSLYAFAKKYRGTGNGDGFYPSSFDDDEMAWGAIWLYIATGTRAYLDDIIATDASGHYTGYLKKIIAGPQDTWQNIWVHSWDTVWGGVFAKLAPVTQGVIPDEENQKYWYYFRWNVEYWSGGKVKHEDSKDGNYLEPSPGGFGVVSTWGSARYNTAAQLCALVFRKYAPNHPNAVPLTDWALSQMNYIMGDNPMDRSYIVGFGDSYAKHPHHRAAHGSSTNSMLVPAEHRHTLWGALVGGPDKGDNHKDETTDYVYNEVAIDYNAAFVGALAGLYKYYGSGQTVSAWKPPAEPAEVGLFANAKVEQENKERSQITVQINNTGTHPPKWEEQLSLRYYFDISELVEHGQSIADVKVDVYYDESKTLGKAATVTGPTSAGGNLYYVQAAWTGVPLYGKRDLQFALVVGQDSQWKSWWDPTNDPSRTGLTATDFSRTERIPVYNAGTRVFGQEPTGVGPTTNPTTNPTTGPTTNPTTGPTTNPTTGPTAGPTARLKARYAAGSTNASTGDIRFRLSLANTGTAAVDLSKVKVRYWYTRDNSTAAQAFSCDWAVVGCSKITGSFGVVSPARTGADAYLELSFASGSVGAGADSGEIQGRFNRADWSPYTQTGDYSFDATKSALADWDHITVYYDGALIWGVEP